MIRIFDTKKLKWTKILKIGEVFGNKYGKKYADACKVDALNNVNDKVSDFKIKCYFDV